MHACQNCGKLNAPESHFCRFCGTKLVGQQPMVQNNPYDHSAPKPYAWKTDEFQKTQSRATGQVSNMQAYASPQYQPAPLAHLQQQPPQTWPKFALDANYRCPRCGTTYHPVIDRRVSTAGWIVFSVLLVTTLIFFWIGLLMKEDAAVCPVCRSKLN